MAPFVAAALRDKVVAEQLEEIEQLRAELRKARKVAISGPQGTPVYAEGQIEDGYPVDSTRWHVDLVSGNPETKHPFSSLALAEFRLGGIIRAEILNSAEDAFLDDYDEEEQRMDIAVHYVPGLWISFSVGPVPRQFYNDLAEVDTGSLLQILLERCQQHHLKISLYWKDVVLSGGTANEALQDMKLLSPQEG